MKIGVSWQNDRKCPEVQNGASRGFWGKEICKFASNYLFFIRRWLDSAVQSELRQFVVTFAFNFRKSVSQVFKRVVRCSFEVRWKVLTLARRTVGQTLESDLLKPISRVLKWQGCQRKRQDCVVRAAPKRKVFTFGAQCVFADKHKCSIQSD